MKRLPLIAALIAIAAGIAVLLSILLGGDPGGTTPSLPDRETATGPKADALESDGLPQGGVYGGVVVDESGAPIHGVQVALGLYEARGRDLFAESEADPEAPIDPGTVGRLPVIGEIRLGPRATTDKAGRWRIAAGPRDYVHGAFAWDKRFFPGVTNVDKPRDDYRIVLEGAGRVVGTVVDEETGAPVANARVDIYIQNWAPTVPASAVNDPSSFKVKQRRRDPRVQYMRIFKDELRGFIWGQHTSTNPKQPGETIRLRTDRAGRFELSPLGGDGLQFEFVITHPEYKWHDHDTDDGAKQARRTTVRAGEVVERTFKLKRGLVVSGVVRDENGTALEGVRVEAENISGYFKHWWYKFRQRVTTTDKSGRFRLAGLAIGRQNLTFIHGSFGRHVEPGIEAPSEGLEVEIPTRGGLTGTVVGLSTRPIAGRIRVALTRRGEGSVADTRQERSFLLGSDNRFQWTRIEPGQYDVEVIAVTRNAQFRTPPTAIEIQPSEVLEEQFRMAEGGSVRVEVVDGRGRIIDPLRAEIARQDGNQWRPVAQLTGSEGEVRADTLLPGTYRLELRAPGFVTRITEPFTITGTNEVELTREVMTGWAWARIRSVLGPDGRAPAPGNIVVEFREGEKGSWIRYFQRADRDRPVAPGAFFVRAVHEATKERFEQRYEVSADDLIQVDIRLGPPADGR